MIEVVDSPIVVNGVSFPGYISTDLGDRAFLKQVMLGWGQWPNTVAEDHLSDGFYLETLEDKSLRKDGYFVGEDGSWDDQGVILLKAGEGEWVVLGMSFEELEEFAEACEEKFVEEPYDKMNAFLNFRMIVFPLIMGITAGGSFLLFQNDNPVLMVIEMFVSVTLVGILLGMGIGFVMKRYQKPGLK